MMKYSSKDSIPHLRVMLIQPYVTIGQAIRQYPSEPLGLLYLASYLNQCEMPQGLVVQTQIVDAQLEGADTSFPTSRGYRSGMTDNQLTTRIQKFKPDIVGVACSYAIYAEDALEVSATVKASVACLLVVGGPHATTTHWELIENNSIDVVVRGEGEITFCNLVHCIIEQKSFEKVRGITYKLRGRKRANPDQPRIQNLDRLPIPDRSFINYPEYLRRTRNSFSLNQPVGAIMSSRGCPYACSFCVVSSVWTTKWIARSATNILKEIEYLSQEYGVREVCFLDDQFLGSKKRALELCNLIHKKSLQLSFTVPSGLTPGRLDSEILHAFTKANFYRVCFSFDVGNKQAQRHVGKPVDLSTARELVRSANRRGIWTYATFMIGFPDESEEDIAETIRYSRNLGLDYVKFYLARAYFGTKLYNNFVAKRFVEEDPLIKKSDIINGGILVDQNRLIELRHRAENGYLRDHLSDFLNLAYLFTEFIPKLLSMKRLKYFLKLIKFKLSTLLES